MARAASLRERLCGVDKRRHGRLGRALQHSVAEVEEVLPLAARVANVLVHRRRDLLLRAKQDSRVDVA